MAAWDCMAPEIAVHVAHTAVGTPLRVGMITVGPSINSGLTSEPQVLILSGMIIPAASTGDDTGLGEAPNLAAGGSGLALKFALAWALDHEVQ